MNAATNGQYPSLFNVVYDIKTNTIEILITNNDIAFYILTPKDLNDKLGGIFQLDYDKNNTLDCNEILGNLEGNPSEYDITLPFRSNYLNLQPIRNLYLHSSIGTYTTLAKRPNGYDNTIINHIAANSNCNEMIFDELNTANDWFECGGQALKMLGFQIRTSKGDIVPLHGVNMSFSLIFTRNLDLS